MAVRTVWHAAVLAIAVSFGGNHAMADEGPAAATPRDAGCTAPEYRQFDFWIGSWVVSEAGQPAGRNDITPDLNRCALFESWTSVDGSRGRSVNYYDRAHGRWRQSWIDDRGGVLELNGQWLRGSMVLEGERPAAGAGPPVRHRISWTPNADGSVRQHWQTLKNPHGAWETVFDGLYRRAP
jgi:hypothetical protein